MTREGEVEIAKRIEEGDALVGRVVIKTPIAVKEILSLNPEAKVIVSSGYSNDPVMADYEEYGFCGSIEKPYRMKDLARVVGAALSSGEG